MYGRPKVEGPSQFAQDYSRRMMGLPPLEPDDVPATRTQGTQGFVNDYRFMQGKRSSTSEVDLLDDADVHLHSFRPQNNRPASAPAAASGLEHLISNLLNQHAKCLVVTCKEQWIICRGCSK